MVLPPSDATPEAQSATATPPPENPMPTPFAVRQIMRMARKGALATGDPKDGHPYVSLVTCATDVQGAPVFLLSTLAQHTQHLMKGDQRCALLLEGNPDAANPQRTARVTLLGQVHPLDTSALDPRRAQARFLALHPQAQQYAHFADFAFYGMAVHKVQVIGGFARARWLKADAVFDKAACALAAKDIPAIWRGQDGRAVAAPPSTAETAKHIGRVAEVDSDGMICTAKEMGWYCPFSQPHMAYDAMQHAVIAE